MITSKQVNLLIARFIANRIHGDRARMDWLFERDIDCQQDYHGRPNYEAMTPFQLDRALKELEAGIDA